MNTESDLTTYLNLINPNDVIIIEDENGVKNYTFTLDLVEEGKLTNLVVQDNNGSYTYDLIEYTANDMEQWLDDVYVNESTLNTAAASVTDLGKVEVMTCPTFDYICPSGNHGSGQVGSCAYLLSEWSITMVNGDCNSGGGGGSSPNPSGGGGGSNPVIITTPTKTLQPWEEVLVCLSGIGFNGFNGEIAWLQENKSGAGQILSFLEETDCSQESQNEAVNLIETLMNPYVNLDDDLVSVNNLYNDCAKNIIAEDIIGNTQDGTNAGFINKIRNIFNNDSNVTLLFRNDDVSVGNGVTSFDEDTDIASGQYSIAITLDNAYLNSNPTKLHIALVVIHEMVHALLMYQYLHGTLLTENPSYTNLNTAMEVFLDNRNATNAEALDDAMHIAMVDFIGTMSYSLFKYAENAGMSNITHQYCKDIVKGSFYNTPAMPLINTGDNTAEELNNKNVHEQDNTANSQGDDC